MKLELIRSLNIIFFYSELTYSERSGQGSITNRNILELLFILLNLYTDKLSKYFYCDLIFQGNISN
jgi:hypothetical protein